MDNKLKLLDTTFLIDLLRGKQEAIKIARSKELFLTTQINIYEVMKGMFLRNVSSRKFLDIQELFENIRVLPLDDAGLIKSAEISSFLTKKGLFVADSDCLIAGITLSKGVSTIVTKNIDHFSRMKGIEVEQY